jgi:hypothetical protein
LLITASALALAALGARIRHWPLFGGRVALTASCLASPTACSASGSTRGSAKTGPILTRCPFSRRSASASRRFCNG